MNNLNPDISIIVPVFNVEKYLARCLDSIFDQEFSGSFEVIAVEDASTDNSLQVLKSYQEYEKRLKVIEHGVNKKLSIARATGMKASLGNYIMHVDSDDWLLPNALENLFKKCVESKADVVVFNHVIEDSEEERTNVESIKKEIFTTDKLKVQQHFYGAPWNKIVKKHLTEHMISGEIGVNNTEDLLYVSEILFKAETICLIPEYYYAYFANTSSLTYVINSEQYILNQVIILSQLQKIIQTYNPNLKHIRNLLNYFENWIYLEVAKIYFLGKKNRTIDRELGRKFSQFPIMTKAKIRRLELSLNYKYVALLEVTVRFGIKLTLAIILRRFKK